MGDAPAAGHRHHQQARQQHRRQDIDGVHDAAAAPGGDDAPYPQARHIHVHIHIIHIILSVPTGNGAQCAVLRRQLRQAVGPHAL